MRQLTLKVPAGLFAAVQVETVDGKPVGAAGPCFEEIQVEDGIAYYDDENQPVYNYRTVQVPKKTVAPYVLSSDKRLRLRWVHEDSSQGHLMADYQHGGSRWG